MFNIFLLFILVAQFSFLSAMDKADLQEMRGKQRKALFEAAHSLNFKQAQQMLNNATELNWVEKAEAVLSRSDFKELPQGQKDGYLLECASRPQIALLLVEMGANPNIHQPATLNDSICRCFIAGKEKYCSKKTLLHGSVQGANVLNVQLLVNMANVDINARDHKQNTPLMLACKIDQIRMGDQQITFNHYLTIIELLIKHGANKELVNKRGKTATQIAFDLKRDADRNPDLMSFSDQIVAKLEQTQK
ncbi:hypothetical protein BH09DEP1_BH09DEP1_4760 [soil metagenome]